MNTYQQINLFQSGQPDEEAIRLLRGYEDFALKIDPRGYCVCTSEGKDSRVLGHLMRRAGVKHFYIHNITGIDPPELVYFQRRNFREYQDMGYEVHDCMYDMSIWQLMKKKRVPPMRHMRYCCEHLKEKKTLEQGNAMICTGVRRAESTRRAKQRAELEHDHEHLNPYDQEYGVEVETWRVCFDNPKWGIEGLWTLNPIAEWPDHWIWDYSKEAHLEQCSLYNEGFDRLGCIGCPMGGECQRRRQFERWPGFRNAWLRAFRACIDGRKESGLPTPFTDPEEWMEWWLSDKTMGKVDKSQITLWDLEESMEGEEAT
jgi:phosphoadenosine phosphosulfate reductase|nr:MAG TPA: phosphoadenosine-phosphosulfate reductase [Caudoviricetes sp.]